MRKVLVAAFAALAIAGFGASDGAEAGRKCKQGVSADSCGAFQRAQGRTKPVGRLNLAGKSCGLFVQKGKSALTANVGGYKSGGEVIASSGNFGWKDNGDGTFTKLFCIKKSALAAVGGVFTVCGSVGHYTFRGSETAQFKRQSGPLGGADVARMWSGG